MSIPFVLSDELEITIKKLVKKDKGLARELLKKIDQIVNLEEGSLDHFKNLRGDLKDYKRVHVRNYVLTFHVTGGRIIFVRFCPHDKAYG